MRVILCTVGTSLLGNLKRDEHRDDPDEHQLAAYIKSAGDERASAETNTVSRLAAKGDHVVFLHSSTPDGARCAAQLVKWARSRGFESRSHEIPGLAYDAKAFALKGLIALASVLAREIRQARQGGHEVVISGTGGFKAEVAVASQVAAVFGVPMYYIHELLRDMIEIPAAPLSWDFSLIAEYEDLFEWVLAESPTEAEFEQRWPQLPQSVAGLIAVSEGRRLISPLAEAYYEAFLDRLANAKSVRLELSRAARKSYDRAAPSVREKFDKILSRLRVDGIRAQAAKQEPNCDCLSFPSGRYDERLFYWTRDDGVLHVVELVESHGRDYDKLIHDGVRRSAYGSEYTPY